MIDKNKKKETVKAEPKKMPERGSSERGSSERIDSQKLKENQAPPKRTEVTKGVKHGASK